MVKKFSDVVYCIRLNIGIKSFIRIDWAPMLKDRN